MNAAPIQLLYATHDGQTRRIAQRLATRLHKLGRAVALADLAVLEPDPALWEEDSTVVIVAPIRFGYHLPPVESFLKHNRKILENQSLVMISVNLTARKALKNETDTNPYFRKWVKRHGLTPALGAVLGGRLEYRLYKTWEKWAIRLIMALTGGPTDFDAVVDYTPWDRVDALADQIAALSAQREAA